MGRPAAAGSVNILTFPTTGFVGEYARKFFRSPRSPMEAMDTRSASSHHSQRGFWALIVTQFQGAFSENTLKTLVVFLIAGMGLAPAERDRFVLIVGACFSLPFIFFSMLGGNLADRFSKRSVTIWTKIISLAVMIFALAGLAKNNIYWELAAVFLASTPAAIFGPSKYGLLPELLPEQKLSWGNGVIELGTFAAIIFGTAVGAIFSEHFHGRQIYSGAILVALGAIGLATSFAITRVPAANPAARIRINFLGDLFTNIREIKKDQPLFMALLASTYFFFIGALINFNIVFYGSDVLHIGESKSAVLLSSLGIGIGVGSMVAGLVSRNKIEYGLIPMGSIGMAIFGFTLFNPSLRFQSIAWLLAGLGFFGGFFIVPVNAILQHRPADDKRGGVLATANLLSFVGIFGASFVYFALTATAKIGFVSLPHLRPESVFLASGLLTLAATIYIVILLPHWLVRLVLWAVTNTIYRIRVVGRDNIPEKGGALFVCNHLSFVDALLLTASTDRFIRFIMFKDIYDHPLVHPLAKLGRAIPISSDVAPARHDQVAARSQRDHQQRRHRLHLRRRADHAHRADASLPPRHGTHHEGHRECPDHVPCTSTASGAASSASNADASSGSCRAASRIPSPSASASRCRRHRLPFEVRQAVQDLHSNAYAPAQELHAAAASAVRWHCAPSSVPLCHGGRTTAQGAFFSALAKTIFLARRLRPRSGRIRRWSASCLPPSVGGALVNYAALLCGKVPVNLNYTASNESSGLVREAVRYAAPSSLRRRFWRAFQARSARDERILLEDVAQAPGAVEKLAASACVAAFLQSASRKALGVAQTAAPRRSGHRHLLQRQHRRPQGRDALALQHRLQHRSAGHRSSCSTVGDRMLGILPFFHSFGFTGTLWLPAADGIGVRLPSESARLARSSANSSQQYRGHVPARHAHLPAGLHAPLRRPKTSAACNMSWPAQKSCPIALR